MESVTSSDHPQKFKADLFCRRPSADHLLGLRVVRAHRPDLVHPHDSEGQGWRLDRHRFRPCGLRALSPLGLATLDRDPWLKSVASPSPDTRRADSVLLPLSPFKAGGSHESYVRNVLCDVIRPKSQGGLGVRAAVVNVRISSFLIPLSPSLTPAMNSSAAALACRSPPPPNSTLRATRRIYALPSNSSGLSTLSLNSWASASASGRPS